MSRAPWPPFLLDVLHVPEAARVGIAWGASATWADMRPGESVEQLVELYLSDPDAYAARASPIP